MHNLNKIEDFHHFPIFNKTFHVVVAINYIIYIYNNGAGLLFAFCFMFFANIIL